MRFVNQILAEHSISGAERNEASYAHYNGLKAPDWVQDGPVYEVFLRAFSEQGDFRALQNKLPVLKDLGIQTIWLMPIHPIGELGRKGSWGSPYAVKDFFGINPDHGTENDFRALVCEIHHHGMKIIIDLVANHAAKDHKLFQKHPQLVKTKRSSLAGPWTDIQEFDFKQQYIRDYMLQVMTYWIHEYNIDGYRCDSAGLIPLDFWEQAAGHLQQIKPDIFLLAEWESAAFHQNAFHSTYDWSLFALQDDIRRHKNFPQDILQLLGEKAGVYPRNSLPLRFTENHDHLRTSERFGVDSFYPYVVLNFMLHGVPLIYAGQEYGIQKKPELFERDVMDLSCVNIEIFAFYKRLIHMRKDSDVLRSRNFNNPALKRPQGILMIEKNNGTEKGMAILNYTHTSATIDIPMEYPKGLNIKSGHQIEHSGSIDIEPWGVNYLYQ